MSFEVPLSTAQIKRALYGEETKILDIGCGEADYHQELYEIMESRADGEQEIKIYGIDPDKESILEAKQENDGENFQYMIGRVESNKDYQTPINNSEFDLVIGQHAICDADNTQEIYEESVRLAKGDGERKRVEHRTC